MNYHLRNKPKDSKVQGTAWAVLVCIVGIMLFNFFAPQAFSGTVHWVSFPFLKAGGLVRSAFATTISYFESKRELALENAQLKQALFEQNSELLVLSVLKDENEELKSTFGRTTKQTLIYAPVLKGPGFSPYDTFLLDGGRNVGIAVGDKITVGTTTSIGYIAEVYDKTSLGRLYSSPGEELQVIIEGQRSGFKAVGRGNGNFEIKAPRDLVIEKGAKVYTPGLIQHVVGVVEDKEANIAHSLQTLYFKLPMSIQGVRAVLVESAQ